MRASAVFTSTLIIALAACAPFKRSDDAAVKYNYAMGGSTAVATDSKRGVASIDMNALRSRAVDSVLIERQDDGDMGGDVADVEDFTGSEDAVQDVSDDFDGEFEAEGDDRSESFDGDDFVEGGDEGSAESDDDGQSEGDFDSEQADDFQGEEEQDATGEEFKETQDE